MNKGEFVFVAVLVVQFTPVAGQVPPQIGERRFVCLGECLESAGSCDELSGREPERHSPPRNPASLAVARYCGMGSSSLKAEVKALERLHMVRGWNSSWAGLK